MLYSSGKLARQDATRLYDFESQEKVQQSLVAPTQLWGLLPYNYPPYVAFAVMPLTFIPMAWALGLWSLGTVLMGVLAARGMYATLAPENIKPHLSEFQLTVITLSFFPFVEGLLVGQNHAITLLLIVGILASIKKERWALAGLCAGLTIYKPQIALGFVILWLIWRRWRALLVYILTALLWVASAALVFGIPVYLDYLQKMELFLKMLYIEGFGTYLEVTPYGLFISIFPPSVWSSIVLITQILTVILAAELALYGWKVRQGTFKEQLPALILALLFPLLAAPHTLLHDLIILAPALLLWAHWQPDRRLALVSAAIYLATFLLPWISYAAGIPFLALIPIGLVGFWSWQVLQKSTSSKSH